MTRLYLIDDHPIVRAGLSALLQGAGHTVVGEGDDITQALSDLNRLQPDVVLLDLHLDPSASTCRAPAAGHARR